MPMATKESLIAPQDARRGGCLPTIGVTAAIHHPAGDSKRRRDMPRARHAARSGAG